MDYEWAYKDVPIQTSVILVVLLSTSYSSELNQMNYLPLCYIQMDVRSNQS